MPSLLSVLVHDPDLPDHARAALYQAHATPPGPCREAAKHHAAAALVGLFDLTHPEVADLVGLPSTASPRPPTGDQPC